jgi:hypothetical protein
MLVRTKTSSPGGFKSTPQFVHTTFVISSDSLTCYQIGYANSQRSLLFDELIVQNSYPLGQLWWEEFNVYSPVLKFPEALSANALIGIENPDKYSFHFRLSDQFGATIQRIGTNFWCAWFQGRVDGSFGQFFSVHNSL